ncbi:MAG: alpha-amylase family glycosyl hydrolase [Phycisphaerales bacterium]
MKFEYLTREIVMRKATWLVAAATLTALGAPALAQITNESPSPTLQWFECPWADMEHRMGDYFIAGYGSVWLPPVSRGYLDPNASPQNSTSAGYDVFDRFNLGKPGATTAFGTEATFDAVVAEFHRAGTEVYIDTILNHNSTRQTGVTFQANGGFPGFWMASTTPITNKSSTSNWGDFHPGTSGGYYQSENPGGSRYCLQGGDLVALCDIDQASNNMFIRQPIVGGNPLNLPGGTFFNNPDPANARFYPDPALGTDTINNPGMTSPAGVIGSGVNAALCTIPARTVPPSQLTVGRFNLNNPGAGVPVAENATGYLLRWTQWMLDVHHVDGFRLDAIKHVPSWFFDTYWDAAVYHRRVTPDGRLVTPFSFGESVDSNDFGFDRYIRKPNGRTTGRSVAGDAFGNRDLLDLNGAGALRDLVGGGGLGSWNNIFGAMLDNTDDGYLNGSISMAHVYSHDNGTAGDGNSNPPTPTPRQQGWFAHAFMLMRPGHSIVYHNGRGIARTNGFYPRQGLPVALGTDSNNFTPNPVITKLVQLSNQFGRGEYQPRSVDGDVIIYERSTPLGGGAYSANCIVGANDRYDAGYDSRTVATTFPGGTRLYEYTGNATDATVDPNNEIFDTVVVAANGTATIRVPRNVSSTGIEHNKGFVVYAPAIPAGSVTIVGSTSSLAVEGNQVAPWRRRQNAVPVVSGNSFDIQLTTTNGDAAAANNDNADDNALFRIDAGYTDWNGNGISDIDYQSDVTPGYEQFVTQRQPLYNTVNTQGVYRQSIDATRLDDGMHYVSVVAFRHRNAAESPIFREFRVPIYVDRADPQASLLNPSPLALGTVQYQFAARAADRTVSRVHLILNPASTGNPLSLANNNNLSTQIDRFDWTRTLTGLQAGPNTVLLCAFEDSGRGAYQYYTVYVGNSPCDPDVNQDGNADQGDVDYLINVVAGGDNPSNIDPDFNQDGNVDQGDVDSLIDVVAGGDCP